MTNGNPVGVKLLPAHTIAPDTVHCMDALRLLNALPSASVDAVITDPPYNMTNLAFEEAIDWTLFWREARRVLKAPTSPVIMFSQQPFTTDLICSNRKGFRREIIWHKTMPTGFLDAKRRELRAHENILIFADKAPEYTPQMETTTARVSAARKKEPAKHYGKNEHNGKYEDNGSRYPTSVWKFAQRHNAFENTETLHPTEKPLALMERLVLTYTRENWLIVDPFMGSGTTLAAAQILNRRYIGCDVSAEYVDVSKRRLAQPYTPDMFAGSEAV